MTLDKALFDTPDLAGVRGGAIPEEARAPPGVRGGGMVAPCLAGVCGGATRCEALCTGGFGGGCAWISALCSLALPPAKLALGGGASILRTEDTAALAGGGFEAPRVAAERTGGGSALATDSSSFSISVLGSWFLAPLAPHVPALASISR